MKLSVVIAIGRREDSIPRVLEAACKQDLDHDAYEVVIVDRTPDDHYAGLVSEAAASGTRFVYESAADWSKARAHNTALDRSSGDVVYFLGDDFVPPPHVFAGHLAFHKRRPEPWRAATGPANRVIGAQTALTEWHERDIAPFRPPPGTDPDDVAPFDATCANTSVKKAFLLENGRFDEDFTGEGFEDIELLVRLHASGLRITFDASLNVIHDHDVGMAELLARWQICGQMARVFDTKHPGLRQNVVPQDATQSLSRARYDAVRSGLKSFLSRTASDRQTYHLTRLELAFVKGYGAPAGPIVYPYELEHVH